MYNIYHSYIYHCNKSKYVYPICTRDLILVFAPFHVKLFVICFRVTSMSKIFIARLKDHSFYQIFCMHEYLHKCLHEF